MTAADRIVAFVEAVLDEGADPDTVLDVLAEATVSLAATLDRGDYLRQGAQVYFERVVIFAIPICGWGSAEL